MTKAPTTGGETLLHPGPGRRTTGHRSHTPGLSDDLLSQSAERLRVMALLYAFVFFMVGFLPALLVEQDRVHLM